MRSPLTSRQEQIYQFLRAEIENKGRPPSLREIGARFDMTPPSVADHLTAIESKGYILRVPGERRSIRLVDGATSRPNEGLPLLGHIAAGAPLLAPAHIEEWLPVTSTMFRPAASFLLRVNGDSMIDLGIYGGDLVAIHAQQTADSGQIIAAILRNSRTGELETTLKRIRIEQSRILLNSENRAAGYPSIVVPNDGDVSERGFEIAGVYCGHIHFDGPSQ